MVSWCVHCVNGVISASPSLHALIDVKRLTHTLWIRLSDESSAIVAVDNAHTMGEVGCVPNGARHAP